MTSNKSLATWADLVGGDSALMMVLVDHLWHHGEVFYLRGSSYRMRGKETLGIGPSGPVRSLKQEVGTNDATALTGLREAEANESS